jgi:hypothetical protein
VDHNKLDKRLSEGTKKTWLAFTINEHGSFELLQVEQKKKQKNLTKMK